MGFVRKSDNLEKIKWKSSLCFECLNVKIGVRSNNPAFINRLKRRFPEIVPIPSSEITEEEVRHLFSVTKGGKSGKEFRLYKGSDFILTKMSAEDIVNYLESQIRSIIAEHAEEFVFLHAGVVSWKGRGIVIPGKSFSGKSTLVSELIKRDCEYLSDEFAVIDKKGYVHPFPKKISMRGIIDEYKQVDLAVAEFGGRESKKPVPVDYFLVTEYKKERKKPRIKIDSTGEGVMVGVANSISIRQNPRLVLEVLSLVAERALILKTKRGEAGEFAEFLLNYLEKIESSKANVGSVKSKG